MSRDLGVSSQFEPAEVFDVDRDKGSYVSSTFIACRYPATGDRYVLRGVGGDAVPAGSGSQ